MNDISFFRRLDSKLYTRYNLEGVLLFFIYWSRFFLLSELFVILGIVLLLFLIFSLSLLDLVIVAIAVHVLVGIIAVIKDYLSGFDLLFIDYFIIFLMNLILLIFVVNI